MPWFSQEAPALTREQIHALAQRLLEEARSRLAVDFRRVLLLPPDLTRAHSGAGANTVMLYKPLPERRATRGILTQGQHRPPTSQGYRWQFGETDHERHHLHDWRNSLN